jgi:hypothetical protein
MKNLNHQAGPAFDKARDIQEAWRQQQIVALTQEQRQEYDRRVQDEQNKLESETQRIEAQKPQRVATERQTLLSGKPAPELSMIKNDPMKQKKAGELAKAKVEQKSSEEIERRGKEAEQRLDGYLSQAERQRTEQQQKGNGQKEQSRSNKALARAFEKANRQQQSHQNTQDKETRVQGTQDKAHSSESGRERDRN